MSRRVRIKKDSMISLPRRLSLSGQMLIGILIAIAIFLILAHALFTLISSSFELVSFNKARITARHIATEKMELIRNLSYGDVATINGAPPGTIIPQTETIVRNGLSYTVKTSIIYIDDPFDQTAPSDTDPEDYKRVRIEVSWEGVGQSRKNPVVLMSDFSPNATGTTDGGTMVILVFDANSDPVSQAEVTIVSSGITPAINLTEYTNNDGQVSLPGLTPCVSCYRITATKTGYSTDRTYSTSEVTNPIKPDTSIFADDVTQISFAIDTLGSLNITSVNSRENNFTALSGVPFRLRGNKIIGTDASAQLVYKYDKNFTTDGSGNKSLQNIEWDVYRVLMPSGTSYDISGTSPLLPFYLTPGGTMDFTFAASPHTLNSLFLTIKDPTQNLIASASAHLTEGGGYDESKFTGESVNPDHGQALFSNLDELTYTLTATASGFLDYTGNFDVTGYTQSEVVLTPQ